MRYLIPDFDLTIQGNSRHMVGSDESFSYRVLGTDKDSVAILVAKYQGRDRILHIHFVNDDSFWLYSEETTFGLRDLNFREYFRRAVAAPASEPTPLNPTAETHLERISGPQRTITVQNGVIYPWGHPGQVIEVYGSISDSDVLLLLTQAKYQVVYRITGDSEYAALRHDCKDCEIRYDRVYRKGEKGWVYLYEKANVPHPE